MLVACGGTVPFDGHCSEATSRLTIMILLYKRIPSKSKVNLLRKMVIFKNVRGRLLNPSLSPTKGAARRVFSVCMSVGHKIY